MRALLLLTAFIAIPLLELWVIGEVNAAISLGPTLALLLLDSVLGAVLVRREGARAWNEFREALAAGRLPGDELIGGVLLLFGGALLLTPGFITDVAGLALVVPLTRRPLAALVRRRATAGGWQVVMGGPGGGFGPGGPAGGAGPFGTGGGSGTRRPGGDAGGTPSVEVVSVERDEPPAIGDGG